LPTKKNRNWGIGEKTNKTQVNSRARGCHKPKKVEAHKWKGKICL